ncbi:MAG: substrate-binding domain-containing protein [Mycetocola sp.]
MIALVGGARATPGSFRRDQLRAVAENGLTARDLSVVGYHNIELASHPLVSLTAVDQYAVMTGATAIELLMERIEHSRSEPRHVSLDPQWISRNSSAQAASRPSNVLEKDCDPSGGRWIGPRCQRGRAACCFP